MTPHDEMIKHFVDTDESHCWMHPRFRKATTKFSLGGLVQFLQRDESNPPSLGFTPDAWDIDFLRKAVALLEVVDQNPISREKLDHIHQLVALLDAHEFSLEMVVHDITTGTTLNVSGEQMWNWAFLYLGHGQPWKSRDRACLLTH